MPAAAGQPHTFDDELKARLRANVGRLDRLNIPLDERRHAAVAIVVVSNGEGASDAERATDAAVLLTRRTAGLRAHPGQWALPGGRLDRGEHAVAAAQRELDEELGLDLDASAVLGSLDDYPTRSGYVITPVVFWGGADPALQPNPAEVHSVHRVSFEELTRRDSPRFVTIPESDQPVVQLPIGRHLIHAPTAAVLLQFRRVAIDGVMERVAHLEQPRFAWG